MEPDLRARITAMSDQSLLAVVENKSDEYTAEALAIASEEVSRRGGIELLKQKVFQSRAVPTGTSTQEALSPEIPNQSSEILSRLKKFYGILVLAAYLLFIYVLRGSLWFYWFCVFLMIAFWIKVLINARRLSPEEEYAEIAREMAKHPQSESSDDQSVTDQGYEQ